MAIVYKKLSRFDVSDVSERRNAGVNKMTTLSINNKKMELGIMYLEATQGFASI